MATSFYDVGSVTLTNGSAVVTGVGTLWQTALITNGFVAVEAPGNLLPILAVDSDSQITAEQEWTGDTGTYSYGILRQTDQMQDNAENSRALAYVISEIRNGTLFKYDAAGTLADRALYNERPKGFSYLVFAGTSAQLYVKASATSGDWSGPFAYGTGPTGPMGPAGFTNFRGTYAAGTTYIRNDGVYHNGSSWVALQTTTGNAPPNLPTTSNAYWSLLASKGTDGTGIGDMLKATYDPQNLQTDAFNRANHTGRQSVSTLLDGSILSGFRNKIINGAMEIWQRGTGPFTTTGYTADRWYLASGTGATNSITRTVAAAAYPDAIKYVLSWTRTVAGTSASQLIQKMEDVRTAAGKKVTLSFWAASNLPTELQAYMAQVFGSGGSPDAPVNTSATTFSITGTPQQFFVTFDLLSTDGKSFGTNGDDCLWLVFRRLHTSPNPTALVNITDVSVVEGDATAEADPSARRHPQQELALCQRFYEQGNATSLGRSAFSGWVGGGVTYYSENRFNVPKRTPPSMVGTHATSTNFPASPGNFVVGTDGFVESRVANSNGTALWVTNWIADAEL